jgi:hypothetical protein
MPVKSGHPGATRLVVEITELKRRQGPTRVRVLHSSWLLPANHDIRTQLLQQMAYGRQEGRLSQPCQMPTLTTMLHLNSVTSYDTAPSFAFAKYQTPPSRAG